jgi:hypothetical protein
MERTQPMGIFDKLFKNMVLPKPDRDVLWVYVQCSNCDEKIKIRVNPRTDLVPESGETPGSYYTLHKEVMDNKCFRLIQAYLEFDMNRRILMQDIQGGRFIDKNYHKEDGA